MTRPKAKPRPSPPEPQSEPESTDPGPGFTIQIGNPEAAPASQPEED